MRRRTLAAAVVALAVAVGGVAGCGGGDDSASERDTAAVISDADLPAQDVVAGVNTGTTRTIDSASDLVNALYKEGDPAKAAAVTRLEKAGFRGAVIRDQLGENAGTGPARVRFYAMRVRDADAARQEAGDSVDEVRAAIGGPAEDVDTGIPGAEGMRADVDLGNVDGSIFFVTVPAGATLYGIQAVATSEANLHQDELLGVARDLATKAGAPS